MVTQHRIPRGAKYIPLVLCLGQDPQANVANVTDSVKKTPPKTVEKRSWKQLSTERDVTEGPIAPGAVMQLTWPNDE